MHSLKYVCKWCGQTIACFPLVKVDQPATLSVCDRRDCREQASIAYHSR